MTSSFYTCTRSLYHQYPFDSWQLSCPGYTYPELDGIWCGTISSSGHSEKEAASTQQAGTYDSCHGPSPRLPLSNHLLQRAYQQLRGMCVLFSVYMYTNCCCSFRIYPTFYIYRHGRKSLIWTFLIETKRSSHQTPFWSQMIDFAVLLCERVILEFLCSC